MGNILLTANFKISSVLFFSFNDNGDATFIPPGCPVCLKYFLKTFLPVNLILSTFVTITKSPLSIWGLYVGLFQPLKTLDIYAASLPTASFWASIIYQFFFNIFFFNKRCHDNGR